MKTKAEQLIEVAKWLKCQDTEFTKNFHSMRAIIRFYNELPAAYDKKKSVVDFINNNLMANRNGLKQTAEHLSLVTNTLFDFRYFQNAPHKWSLMLYLCKMKKRNDEEQLYVACVPYDRCCEFVDFKQKEMPSCSITIKTINDAKRAAERLIEDMKWRKGKVIDYDVTCDKRLEEAMKQSNPSDEKLDVTYSIA